MIPSLFLCHGSPELAVQQSVYAQFLRELSQQFPQPEAIVVFTAHWESPVTSLTYTDEPYETIYDFAGFSEELYRIVYPAKGSKKIAERIRECLGQSGISVLLDPGRGLDHGVWVLLNLMYPKADIPVIAASVYPFLSPGEQYQIGKALSALREENILVIGSGGTSHNLRLLQWGQTEPADWTLAFDDWLLDVVNRWDLTALFDYENRAPHARLAVPRNEHFVPLFIAMGAADKTRKAALLHRSYDLGTLSLIGLRFD